MRNHITRIFGLAAAAMLVAGTAQAQGRGHDKDKGDKHEDKRADVRDDRGDDRRGDVRRADGNVVVMPQANGDRRIPPGLAKKPGQMPPGQYKKLYNTGQGADVLSGIFRNNGYTVTRVVPSGSSRYVYYRSPDGRLHRAVVAPGTDRLSFSNVPQSLLQQVLSRLY